MRRKITQSVALVMQACTDENVAKFHHRVHFSPFVQGNQERGSKLMMMVLNVAPHHGACEDSSCDAMLIGCVLCVQDANCTFCDWSQVIWRMMMQDPIVEDDDYDDIA